ncbi:hypothetical protein BTS2_3326 [Bacillus sp. TS-2]|nr:hypothetical protein BTS2_3326 [Bacillus sp. TS-2]
MIYKYMCFSCGSQMLLNLEENSMIDKELKDSFYCPKCGKKEAEYIAGPNSDDGDTLENTCLYPQPINNSNVETFNKL